MLGSQDFFVKAFSSGVDKVLFAQDRLGDLAIPQVDTS